MIKQSNYFLLFLFITFPLGATTRGSALKPIEQKFLNNRLLNALAKPSTTKQDIVDLLEQGAKTTATNAQGKSALTIAQENNRPDLIKILTSIQQPIAPKLTQAQLNEQLLDASRDGNLAKIIDLLAQGADVNTVDTYGTTPIYKAAYAGHTEIVNLLINAKANLNTSTIYSMATPLYVAAARGHTEIVRLLITAKANVNTTTTNRTTPLAIATRNGHTEIAQIIQEKINELNEQLLNASQNGNLTEIKNVLTQGAEINFRNNKGDTALYLAAHYNHPEIVQQLIDSGADINLTNNEGETPLFVASGKGHIEVIRSLLAARADLNITQNEGATALWWALSGDRNDIPLTPQRIEIARLLIAAGANVNSATDGITPLLIAAYWGNAEIVRLLLAAGANPNITTTRGGTPLSMATQHGHIQVAQMIQEKLTELNGPLFDAITRGDLFGITNALAKGIDINVRNEKNLTPLLVATTLGNPHVIELLLATPNIKIDLTDEHGNTPLLTALYANKVTIAQKLIRAGADVNAYNSKIEDTPLHVAASIGNPIVVEALILAGADPKTVNAYNETPRMVASKMLQKDKNNKLRQKALALLTPTQAIADLTETHT
jgi:ankyrin repeat protein